MVPATTVTNFTNGPRNIFRQSWQKRADMSLVKTTAVNDCVSTRFTFDVFNVTNTPSFDIPTANVTQNNQFNDFPSTTTALYGPPTGLGVVNKTIDGPRQIQMSLSVLF